jgi:hypothetical protein
MNALSAIAKQVVHGVIYGEDNLRLIVSAVLVATLPMSSVNAQDNLKLCAELSRGEPYIFSGIVPRASVNTAAPVPIKKGAALLIAIYDLKNEWLTVSDVALATDDGTKAPVEFRPFLIQGVRQYCSGMARDKIFGTWPGPDNYLVRCLIDRDGDGRYEAFHRYGELVPYNRGSGKVGDPSGQTVHDRPLVAPIELIQLTNPLKTYRRPIVLTRLSVAAVSPSDMTLRLSAKIGIGPDDEKFPSYHAERGPEQVVPLQEGTFPVHGHEISLRREGKGWVATTRAMNAPPVTLLCSGGIIEAAGNYSLFHAGGSVTLDGDSVRANIGVLKPE